MGKGTEKVEITILLQPGVHPMHPAVLESTELVLDELLRQLQKRAAFSQQNEYQHVPPTPTVVAAT